MIASLAGGWYVVRVTSISITGVRQTCCFFERLAVFYARRPNIWSHPSAP